MIVKNWTMDTFWYCVFCINDKALKEYSVVPVTLPTLS